jgi:transposase-like protein
VTTATPSYKGHRYPVETINHCVWLYFRFPHSFREVEELMLVRGVAVSYEAIRRWCAKFGQAYANQLCRRRQRAGGGGVSVRVCRSCSTQPQPRRRPRFRSATTAPLCAPTP